MTDENISTTAPAINTRAMFNRRQLILFLLGMSSGLPLALSGATLQAWYTDANVDIVTIGWLSWVGQPYVYKMFWAPFLDSIVLPLGKRRGWMFLMQLFLAGLFFFIAWQHPEVNPIFLGFLALLVAFCSATQDLAIDAYRTEILPVEERGMGSGVFVTGYRISMLLSGGLALVFADLYGWWATYTMMGLYMLFFASVTLFAPRTESDKQTHSRLIVIQPFLDMLKRKHMIWVMSFIVLYKLGDALTLSLSTPFLLGKGLGFSKTDVGFIYKTVGMGATLCGALLGGALMTRWSLYRSLMIFGILQGLSSATYMFLAYVGKSYSVMIGSVFLEYFCGGLGTVAFMAFLMSLCNTRYTTTQYALLSALASIGRVYVGPLAGVMVKSIGWVWFYFWCSAIAIPGLLVLLGLRRSPIFTNEQGEP